MSVSKVEINGKSYPKPSLDRLKRKEVKKLKPALERLKNEDLDALWELVGLLVPTLSAAALDALDMGQCKEVLTEAGVAKFEDDKVTEPESESGISVGES